jgi:hypothetical protein
MPGPTKGTYFLIGFNRGSVESRKKRTKGFPGSALNQEAIARPKTINIKKLTIAPKTVAIPLSKKAKMTTSILFEINPQ